MSVQTEIARIQTARNTLRTKAVALGVGLSTDNLTQLATKYDDIIDRGTPNAEVQEGQSYTIEAGYYHGGSVTGVAGGGNYNLQAKSITPIKSEQTIGSDAGYYGLSSVTVGAIPDAYQDVSSVTATAADVLSPAVFVKANGDITAGTMANNGAVSKTLNTTTKSYTIPAGYHNGSGKVSLTTETKTATPTESTQTITPTSGKVLSSVTVNPIPSKYGDASGATVTASHILSGDTAIGYSSADSKAVAITGTMPNNTGWVTDVTSSIHPTKTGLFVPIPDGYHSSSRIDLPSISDLTPIDANKTAATAAQMLTGYQGWVSGAKVSGTMANNGATGTILDGLTTTSYTIPAGYTTGGTVTIDSSIEDVLAAI